MKDNPVKDLDERLVVDSIVNKFIDDHFEEDPRDGLSKMLNDMSSALEDNRLFLVYYNPKYGKPDEDPYTWFFSSNCSDTDIGLVKEKIEGQRLEGRVGTERLEEQCIEDTRLGRHTLLYQMYAGPNSRHLGTVGMISNDECEPHHIADMKQAASRLDNFLYGKIHAAEHHRVIRQTGKYLDPVALHGIDKSLKLLCEHADIPGAILVYYKTTPDPTEDKDTRETGVIRIWNGETKIDEQVVALLNEKDNCLGGMLIEYDRKHMVDGEDAMDIFGISKEDNAIYATDLINEGTGVRFAKLLLIEGKRRLTQSKKDLAETLASKFALKMTTAYYAQKDTLSESMGPKLVECFVARPDLAEYFLKTSRPGFISVVFADLVGYSRIVDRIRNEGGDIMGLTQDHTAWLDNNINILYNHGGYLDNIIGDMIVAQWGLFFPEQMISEIMSTRNIDEVKEIMRTMKNVDHINAYKAVCYATDSLKSISNYNILGENVNVSIGIGSGQVAIVNLNAKRKSRKITSLGYGMNEGARLQSEAEAAGAFMHKATFDLLGVFGRRRYTSYDDFRFHIYASNGSCGLIEINDAQLKGREQVTPFEATVKNITNPVQYFIVKPKIVGY
ncbi:MAG: adenylate/guanylate cyclase domain-containing protein [Nanoarchaeota archaeon]